MQWFKSCTGSFLLLSLLFVGNSSAFVINDNTKNANLTEFTKRVQRGAKQLVTEGIVGKDLQETLGQMPLHHLFYDDAHELLDNSLLCIGCDALVVSLIEIRRQGATKEQLFTFARDLCVNLNIQAAHVCNGVIAINIDIFLHIIDTNSEVDGKRVCSQILQGSKCDNPNYEEWTVEIQDGERTNIPEGSKVPFNILHITDIHYDPIYLEGSLANCKHPVCCQYDSGEVIDAKDAAGYWTEYSNCDVPTHLLDDSLKQIADRHTFDYVYFTGDIISHRVWETAIKNNTEDMQYVFNAFKTHFNGIPVFPILGNHEPHPLNVWAPNEVNQDLSTKWVFDLVAEEWGQWLGPETQDTIKQGGFYTVLVKPGFRIVALNSNVAYIMNWWLLYNDVDNFGQLQWLEGVLHEAEANNEAVHILSHIPSGDDTAYVHWAREYNKLILRYAKTITGIFNGHTHKDELIVYYDERDEPVHVAYNGGSLTPYSDRNPNYRILQIDDANYDVLDYEQYMFRVDEANKDKTKSPVWFKQYSFKDAYGVTGMYGKDVAGLTVRMAEEPSKALLKSYINHKARDGPNANDCDEPCMKKHLCDMVTAVFGEDRQCQKLMDIWVYEP